MNTATYLAKRGHYYYVRLPLSKKDQLLLGRREIWRSLGVSNYREAVEKLSVALYRFSLNKEAFMHNHDKLLSPKQVELLSQEFGTRCYNKCVADGDALITEWAQETYESTVFPYDPGSPPPEGYTFNKALKTFDENSLQGFNANAILLRNVPDLQKRIEKLNTDKLFQRFGEVERKVKKVFSELSDWVFPEGKRDRVESYNYTEICNGFLAEEIRAIEQYIASIDQGTMTTPKVRNTVPFQQTIQQSLEPAKYAKVASTSTSTFGEMVASFNAVPENQGRSKDNLTNIQAYQKFALAIIGKDTPAHEIDIGLARKFYKALNTIPKNAAKHYPKLTLAQIVDQESLKPTELKRLSQLTKRHYWQHIKEILDWATEMKLLDSNPLSSRFRFKKPVAKAPPRKSYPDKSLKILFGDKDFNASKFSPRPEDYWVPVIALFTGMRLGEVLLLSMSEVKKDGDIHFFELSSAEGRSVKTQHSLRKIPVADILVELGFLEYLKMTRKKKHKFVFPNQTAKDPVDAFGKRWRRQLDRLRIKEEDVVFHSFRHSFRDGMRVARLGSYDAKVASTLGGWKSSEVGEGYGTGDALPVLKEVMEKMIAEGMAKACEYAKRGAK